MMRFAQYLVIPLLALAVSGCGGNDQDAPPPPEPERPAEPAPAPERAEPAEPPPAQADPATESEAVARARAEREQLRAGREEPVHWLDDDTLAEQLGLDPDQRATLLEVREALHEARLEGRTELRDLRGEFRALEGDSERLDELQTSIAQVRERVEEAEIRWQDTVRSTLRPEQLEQLEDLIDSPP